MAAKLLLICVVFVVGFCSAVPAGPVDRIVGGETDCSITSVVSLQAKAFYSSVWSHRCGGTILDENSILTAAHCVEDLIGLFGWVWGVDVRVVVGSCTLNPAGIVYPINGRNIKIHPDRNTWTMSNDVAVLSTVSPITMGPGVATAGFPETQPAVGDSVVVAGWGLLDEDGTELSNTMQSVTVEIISSETCNQSYPGEIDDSMLCAGTMAGGKDSCQGDSGGPLFIRDGNGKIYVIGVVSWGNGCARENYPGVYANVNVFLPWIKMAMK